MTSSLFATTIFASFFVVALPHVLPCPAPRVTYADGEIIEDENGRRRRRRRPQVQQSEVKSGIVHFNHITQEDLGDHEGRGAKRECPVPKPGGKVGELLGFKKPTSDDTRTGSSA